MSVALYLLSKGWVPSSSYYISFISMKIGNVMRVEDEGIENGGGGGRRRRLYDLVIVSFVLPSSYTILSHSVNHFATHVAHSQSESDSLGERERL